ncbi:hypothetical protein G7070_15940 [Propioniciclava coleopterorum]|uniref:Uncharacterized protein n=1 Tax=Propioniciclava coleopterorum TaxID=2714937 RepID=A0A6G7YA05_9ACTN|nr:hypothetical protein [Propioniciclava coleopterorum]QIK73478.1 hypothetical protein G7070_15940 [Propioniciclava coleopterorum]
MTGVIEVTNRGARADVRAGAAGDGRALVVRAAVARGVREAVVARGEAGRVEGAAVASAVVGEFFGVGVGVPVAEAVVTGAGVGAAVGGGVVETDGAGTASDGRAASMTDGSPASTTSPRATESVNPTMPTLVVTRPPCHSPGLIMDVIPTRLNNRVPRIDEWVVAATGITRKGGYRGMFSRRDSPGGPENGPPFQR